MASTSKKYWFVSKKYGWGWTPSTWQGWLITGGYLIGLGSVFYKIDTTSHSASDTLLGVMPAWIVLTGFLLIICYLSGEKPYWRWGK